MGNNAIERMAKPSHAQYLIFWARMLASMHMRQNENNFAPFIQQDKGGFLSWLRSDVEALKSEADHLQTVALSKAIDVPITIYCLENIQKGGPQKVQTNEKYKMSSYDLLFRPGHYDVLYRGNDEKIDDGVNKNTEVGDKQNDTTVTTKTNEEDKKGATEKNENNDNNGNDNNDNDKNTNNNDGK